MTQPSTCTFWTCLNAKCDHHFSLNFNRLQLLSNFVISDHLKVCSLLIIPCKQLLRKQILLTHPTIIATSSLRITSFLRPSNRTTENLIVSNMVDVVTKLKIAIPLLNYLAKTKPTQKTPPSLSQKTNLVPGRR